MVALFNGKFNGTNVRHMSVFVCFNISSMYNVGVITDLRALENNLGAKTVFRGKNKFSRNNFEKQIKNQSI